MMTLDFKDAIFTILNTDEESVGSFMGSPTFRRNVRLLEESAFPSH